jgi:hypothetical protein
MLRLAAILALILVIAGCGAVTPGDDSNPVGAYRFSHGRTYGQLMIREITELSNLSA